MAVHRLVLPHFTPATLNALMRGKLRTRINRGKGDRELVCYYAAQSGIPKATGKRRVSLEVTLGPRQRRADVDAYWKGMLDSLQHAGLIVSDDWAWCVIGDLTYHRGPERCTVVVLEEIMTHDSYPCPPQVEDEAAPEPLWERLPTCDFSVFAGGSETYESPCGEPATRRASLDGGQTWLYLCEKHAREVEEVVDG